MTHVAAAFDQEVVARCTSFARCRGRFQTRHIIAQISTGHVVRPLWEQLPLLRVLQGSQFHSGFCFFPFQICNCEIRVKKRVHMSVDCFHFHHLR